MPGILAEDTGTEVLKPQSFYGQQCLRAAGAAKPKAKSKALAKRLKEASATDIRQFAKQFLKAKLDECKTWV